MLSMPLTCKKQVCDVSSILSHMNNFTTTATVSAGSTINFFCENDYVVKGTFHSRLELVCLSNGKFSPEATCQGVCKIEPVSHGMYLKNMTLIVVSSFITVMCDDGYVDFKNPTSSTFKVTCVAADELTSSYCAEAPGFNWLLVILLIALLLFCIILIPWRRKKKTSKTSQQQSEDSETSY